MLSTAQLSMSRVAKMPRWLTITAVALLVAVAATLLLLVAPHFFALVATFGLSEADALWVVTILVDGGLAAVEVAFPELTPVIGTIWWYIDEEGYTAAVDY